MWINGGAERNRNAANQLSFELARQRPLCVHCSIQFSQQAALETRVLVSNAAALAKMFGGTNDGPICSCHHRSDAVYGGHGVFGRVDDVRRRFGGQEPEHTAHVDARGVSGAHAVAAVRCHTIALTRLMTPARRPRRARAESWRGHFRGSFCYSVIRRPALYSPPRLMIFSSIFSELPWPTPNLQISISSIHSVWYSVFSSRLRSSCSCFPG